MEKTNLIVSIAFSVIGIAAMIYSMIYNKATRDNHLAHTQQELADFKKEATERISAFEGLIREVRENQISVEGQIKGIIAVCQERHKQ